MRRTIALLSLIAGMMMAATAVRADEPETDESESQQTEEIEEMEEQIEDLQEEVNKLKRFTISGYIQAEYQHGQQDASLNVGEPSNEPGAEGIDRVGIRRGRLKVAYNGGITSGVFQIDVTEKGVKVKDAYFNLKDPWIRTVALQAGVFNRPFGFEIGHSSSKRFSPERSTLFRTLFPDERDFGGMVILQAPERSSWSVLRLEAGLFAGKRHQPRYGQQEGFYRPSVGLQGFRSGEPRRRRLLLPWQGLPGGPRGLYDAGDRFVLDDRESNIGRYAKRQYVGFDLELGLSTLLGRTSLYAEYIFGQQPGLEESTGSPNYDKRPTQPTYIRPFGGGYVMLAQSLGRLPVSVVVKYDWYDPNTQVKGDRIGVAGSSTGAADLTLSTFGFGALWDIGKHVRLTAYYDLHYNERSAALAGFERDLRDDVFTLRVQYKF